MNSKIHPKYKPLRMRIGNDIFHTYSTHFAEEILMDVDYRTHRAWTKDSNTAANNSNQNISAFNKKFAGLTFGISKSSA